MLYVLVPNGYRTNGYRTILMFALGWPIHATACMRAWLWGVLKKRYQWGLQVYKWNRRCQSASGSKSHKKRYQSAVPVCTEPVCANHTVIIK